MSLRTLMQEGSSKVNDLFARLSDTSEGAVKTREKLFAELKAALDLHSNLEEEFLFPLLRKNPETRGLVVEAIADNKNLRARLAELDTLPKNGEAFIPLLAELQKAFRQHSRDEKKELLPAVQSALSAAEPFPVLKGMPFFALVDADGLVVHQEFGGIESEQQLVGLVRDELGVAL